MVGNGGHPQVIASLVSRLRGRRSAFLVHSIYRSPLLKNEPLDVLALTEPCDLMLAVSRSAQKAVAELRPKVQNRLVYNGTPDPGGDAGRCAGGARRSSERAMTTF